MITLLRFHVVGLVTTLVDFATMIVLVEVAGLTPVASTALGALAGAVTNFLLGRFWTFSPTSLGARRQAQRYVVVSAVSLGLNVFGEFLLHEVLGIGYLLARVLVAISVSLGWNFPLQRRYVFPPHRGAS